MPRRFAGGFSGAWSAESFPRLYIEIKPGIRSTDILFRFELVGSTDQMNALTLDIDLFTLISLRSDAPSYLQSMRPGMTKELLDSERSLLFVKELMDPKGNAFMRFVSSLDLYQDNPFFSSIIRNASNLERLAFHGIETPIDIGVHEKLREVYVKECHVVRFNASRYSALKMIVALCIKKELKLPSTAPELVKLCVSESSMVMVPIYASLKFICSYNNTKPMVMQGIIRNLEILNIEGVMPVYVNVTMKEFMKAHTNLDVEVNGVSYDSVVDAIKEGWIVTKDG